MKRYGDAVSWSPWHGCLKKSEGCLNCYVYRIDSAHGKDASRVFRTADFDLPVRKKRDGSYVIPPGTAVDTCFSTDFFLEEADGWRGKIFDMIRQRPDLDFFFVTKRIERLSQCVPDDWGSGYDNVCIGCTCENRRRADERLPVFLEAPIAHRIIICSPLLEEIDLRQYLGGWIERLVASGESGANARVCDYRWILSLRDQCLSAGVPFWFKETGARLLKDGRIYRIPRSLQHSQARKAGINLE